MKKRKNIEMMSHKLRRILDAKHEPRGLSFFKKTLSKNLFSNLGVRLLTGNGERVWSEIKYTLIIEICEHFDPGHTDDW